MLKNKSKIILIFLLIFLGTLALNINVVNAEETNINMFVENKIADNFIIVEPRSTYRVSLDENFDMVWELVRDTEKLDKLAKSDNCVYESLYIEIDTGIDKVKIKENNQELEIVTKDNKNYIKYDIKIFEKEKGKYVPCNLYHWNEITFQFMNNLEVIKEQKFGFFLSSTAKEFQPLSLVGFSIVDENNKEPDGGIGGQGNAYEVNRAYSTLKDYTNCYYKVSLGVYAGDNIEIGQLGTFTYCGKEKEPSEFASVNEAYIYKKKITDNSLFEKQQDIDVIFEVIDSTTQKGAFLIININVIGETRQSYKVNDKDNNIDITLNGVTDSKVSLQADVIDENNPTYIELTNSIRENANYVFITAYDIKLVGGEYKGDLILTFDLGTENNGKEVFIHHMKQDGTSEFFDEIVSEGKVSITVSELSPFFLSYKKEEQQPVEDNRQLDNEPKTGINNYIILTSLLATLSIVGIVITEKRK